MLSIAGNGLPHQISGLVRNDTVFDSYSSNFGAEIFQLPLSLRASAHTGVAIRTPASEGCCRSNGATNYNFRSHLQLSNRAEKGTADPCKKKKIIASTVSSIVIAVAGLALMGVCFVKLSLYISSQII